MESLNSFLEYCLGKFLNYRNIFSPFGVGFPKVSSPKTSGLIDFKIQTKSSFSTTILFNSLLKLINLEGVISPRKTDFWKWDKYFLHILKTLFTLFSETS